MMQQGDEQIEGARYPFHRIKGVWGFAPCLPMALSHPTNRTAKSASSVRATGNHFAREYMLSHSLPTARTFYSHFPISMS